jgi:hypothetical protein
MRGTIVEIVASRGSVEFIITNPADAKEVQWRNGQPVQKTYKGPSEVRYKGKFEDHYDVKLAVTCWAKASFDVLHMPGSDEVLAAIPPPPPPQPSVPPSTARDYLAMTGLVRLPSQPSFSSLLSPADSLDSAASTFDLLGSS